MLSGKNCRFAALCVRDVALLERPIRRNGHDFTVHCKELNDKFTGAIYYFALRVISRTGIQVCSCRCDFQKVGEEAAAGTTGSLLARAPMVAALRSLDEFPPLSVRIRYDASIRCTSRGPVFDRIDNRIGSVCAPFRFLSDLKNGTLRPRGMRIVRIINRNRSVALRSRELTPRRHLHGAHARRDATANKTIAVLTARPGFLVLAPFFRFHSVLLLYSHSAASGCRTCVLLDAAAVCLMEAGAESLSRWCRQAVLASRADRTRRAPFSLDCE